MANGENLNSFMAVNINEIWKPVSDYEGYYEVSNIGRVKSLDRVIVKSDGNIQRRKGRIKVQTLNSDGYYLVKLSKNGIDERKYVHVLVAKEFVDGYFEGAEVNHKDCNRKNNIFYNLEWVTHCENIKYSIDMGNHISVSADYHGMKNPNYGNHKLKDIYQRNKEYAILKQSRKEDTNGRAIPIKMILPNGNEYDFAYIGECAKYLINNGFTKSKSVNSVRTAITKSIKEKRLYLNIKFITTI